MRYGRATDGSPQLQTLRFALSVAVAVAVAGCAGSSVEVGDRALPRCQERAPAPGHARRVERALGARQDVWGNELLRSRTGPTYDAVRRYLPPLVLARAPGGRAADRVGRPLPRVRTPGRATGLRLGAAPRGRRQSGRLPALAGLEAHDRRRARRTRAIRLVPLAPRGSTARRRLPADPANRLRRRDRRPLPAGVVRRAARGEWRPGELREALRGCSRSVRRRDDPARADDR